MTVYDFDGTIYDGDCTVRFYLFCLKRHPIIIRHWPSLAAAALLYAAKKRSKTAFKQKFYAFLRDIPDVHDQVAAFWQKDIGRIKGWYIAQQKPDDLIISASPEFLVMPGCALAGVRHVMASRVDPKTGQYDGQNCHGEEKIRRYREVYADTPIEAFYSDSHTDDPMARMAKKSHWVKGDAVGDWVFKKI